MLEKNIKIRICYVVSADITLKFILLNQLKFLIAQGYDVSAICSPGKWVGDIEKDGIKIKTIKIKRKVSPVSDVVAFLKFFIYFKKQKFDIVHTHTIKPAFWAQMAARLAGVPIVVNTIHGLDFNERSPRLIRSIVILLEKAAIKFSHVTFSVSRTIIADSVRAGICKPGIIKYLGDGIDLNRFNPLKFSEEFVADKKKELGIGLEKRVIGIIARLVAEKGYLDLFGAVKIIIKKYPETLLVVIGQEELEKKDGIDRGIVKGYGIGKNVIFLGERTDVEEIYALMDVFVLPTHREGLGLATIEASAMAKPVVVTNVGGCPETVDNGKTGLIVPVRSPEKLAKAIIYFLDNSVQAENMGLMGRAKIEREFDERLIFDRIKEEYQRLIAQKL